MFNWIHCHHCKCVLFSESLLLTGTLLQLRFVLSDQSTFSAGGKEKGQWHYEGFYNQIIGIAETMTDEETLELAEWWNE